jgi:hypothetical protein
MPCERLSAGSLDEERAPSVCIVVVNWNGREDSVACLSSLGRIDYPNFKILVVDNGSTDGSVEAIRAKYPSVEVIEAGANLGFSGGNNKGIVRALELHADYVLLLNNDTLVDSALLRAFVEAAKRFPNAAAFSAKIYCYDQPRRIWYAGVKWDRRTGRFIQLGEGLEDDGYSFASDCETDYACGCAFFVPATRLREVGLLDDDFFLFFEETDWCYRARRRGHASIFVPEAKVWHKVSASFGGERSPLALYFITRNRLLWAARHASLSERFRLYANTAQSLIERFVLPLTDTQVQRRGSARRYWWSFRQACLDPQNRAYFLGVRDFFLRRLGNCPDRVRALNKQWSVRRGEQLRNAPIATSLPNLKLED